MLLSGELVRTFSMERWEQKAERGLEQMRGGKMQRGVRSCSGYLWRECQGQKLVRGRTKGLLLLCFKLQDATT